MGSSGSGRHRTVNRGAIDAARRLDMRNLRSRGFLRPGASCSGPVSWTRRGQESGSISLTVDLSDINAAFAQLDFNLDGIPKSQRIALEAVRCRFGGRRFYFRCPLTERRCLVLALSNGIFASRQAHHLTYYSQSEGELDRLIRAKRKAEDRVFGRDGHPIPTGVNRERLLRRFREIEERHEALFASESIRRFGFEI